MLILILVLAGGSLTMSMRMKDENDLHFHPGLSTQTVPHFVAEHY
ncbi:MAG TPA: hypothetical protein VFF11_02615 [Candidatus Binatia bacterium]|nr:hypothetical protein [Candidatus Binatia bacterium]